jgi:hypothetical protein
MSYLGDPNNPKRGKNMGVLLELNLLEDTTKK